VCKETGYIAMPSSQALTSPSIAASFSPDIPGEYLTLAQAAKLAPGRPSANCIWRWCRRGVLARSGTRVCLRHIRAGGKIFTTEQWVHEFCEQLAAADVEHFAQRYLASDESDEESHGASRQQLDQELAEAGL
jgi:hypothetical protein